MKECENEGCTSPPQAKGLCSRHYYIANKARFKANSDRWRKQNPERFREIKKKSETLHPETIRASRARNSKPVTVAKRAQMDAALRKTQAETLSTADRNNSIYTSWELETIANESRTVREVALLTGRTYMAISRMRSLVRKDPKTILRVDIASDGMI